MRASLEIKLCAYRQSCLYQHQRSFGFPSSAVAISVEVIQLLDTSCYFDLLKIAYPSTRDAVIEKFISEKFIKSTISGYAFTNLGALLLAKQLQRSGLYKVVSGIEIFQLPAHDVKVQEKHTRVILNAYQKFADMDIRLLSAGGVKLNLNSTIVKKRFPFPLLSEQIKIIQEIESRLSVCDKIEETIENSLQQAEALRWSIIKKAFEGQLVLQDQNDEPAEKLLERIRALRQSSTKLTSGAQGKQGNRITGANKVQMNKSNQRKKLNKHHLI